MSYIGDYFQQAKTVVFSPEDFFAGKDDLDAFQDAILFAITSSLIFSLLNTTVSRIMVSAGLMTQQINISLVQQYLTAIGAGIVGGLIGPFIIGGVYHIFVLLFGSEGYSKTFQIVAYTTAVNAFFGWIPLIKVIAGIYGLYVTYKGIREFHSLSKGKSVAVILLPVVALVLLGILMAGTIAATFI